MNVTIAEETATAILDATVVVTADSYPRAMEKANLTLNRHAAAAGKVAAAIRSEVLSAVDALAVPGATFKTYTIRFF